MSTLRPRRFLSLLCGVVGVIQACGPAPAEGTKPPQPSVSPPFAPPSDTLDGRSGNNEAESAWPVPVLPGSGPATGTVTPEPGEGPQLPDAHAGGSVERWLVVSCAANPLRFANSPLFVVTRARCRYLDRQEIAAGARRLPSDRIYERPQQGSGGEDQVTFKGAEFVPGADPVGSPRFRIAFPQDAGVRAPLCREVRAVFKERLSGPVSAGDRQIRWLRSASAAAEDEQVWLPESSMSGSEAQLTARRYLEQPNSEIEILILCAWHQDPV